MSEQEWKKCSKCNTDKWLSDFPNRPGAVCTVCTRLYKTLASRRWQKQHREEHLAYMKDYRRRRREAGNPIVKRSY